MQRFDLHPAAARTSVNFGSSSRLTNLGPGTVSYADSDEDTAQGTLAPAATVNLSETRYLWADATATVRVEDLTVGTDAQRLEAVEVRADALESSSASQAADITVVKEAPLNVDHAPYSGNITTAIAALPATGAELYIPAAPSRREGNWAISAKKNLTIVGDGAASVLHVATASQHALSVTGVDQLTVKDLRVQGASGTLDGLHVENCQRAVLERVMCQGSGRYGIYAQRCFGIKVDHCGVGIDVASPFDAGVTNCTDGLVLSWDGTDPSSGCNQFTIDGGHYAVGKNRGWSIRVVRAEGGRVGGPIAELSMGSILLDLCKSVGWDGYYSEFNPTGQVYQTGTASVTNGSAVVTGSGTAWSTLDGEGVVENAAPGKWLIVGGRAQRIASVQSATQLTLESVWGGSTAAGQAHVTISADIVLLDSRECHGLGGYGGGAIIFQNSPRCSVRNAVCEQVFFSTGSDYSTGDVTAYRANQAGGRRMFGNGNWCRVTSYQTGALVNAGPEDWRAVGAASQPAFENSWVNEGSGSYQDAGFFMDGEGVVHLKGVVKSGSLGGGAFTLPAGYRPLKYTEFAVVSNNAFGKVAVYAAGYVVPLTGATTHFSLDGVTFRAEQ